jgi:hypothetical protein
MRLRYNKQTKQKNPSFLILMFTFSGISQHYDCIGLGKLEEIDKIGTKLIINFTQPLVTFMEPVCARHCAGYFMTSLIFTTGL